MLGDKLNEILNPKTLKEVFANNEQGILYERLTASLKEAVMGIKTQMMEDMKKMSDKMAQDIKQDITSEIKIPRDGKDGINIKGKDGKDAIVDEKKIIEEITKEIPKIDQAQIIAEIMAKMPRQGGGRGGGGSTMRMNNLSSQCDGANKEFITTNRIGENHLIWYSSFPGIFLPTTDYLVSGNKITLGAGITAPELGQSLAIFYESSD